MKNNEIIAKIEQFKSTLSDFCNLFCGLSKTGFRDYVTYSKINDDYLPFVESKQIERYITKTNKYIDTNFKFSTKYFLFSDYCYRSFKSPKCLH